MNEQINPVLNHNWAKDLQAKSVSKEVDEAISRSREASVSSLDPSLLQDRIAHLVTTGQGHFLAVPNTGGYYRGRRATMAHINLASDRRPQNRRTRTVSMSPPVGAIWIGV